MELLESNEKIKTKVLKTVKLNNKKLITIEKVLKGNHKNKYVVKSYSKIIFIGYKANDLAAYNIDTDFDGDKITRIEYPLFTLLRQACDYLSYIEEYRCKK